jgi:hypothetical protein
LEAFRDTKKSDTVPPAAAAPPQDSPAKVPPPIEEPARLESLIVGDFPPLFEEFRANRFNLLWRGSRDGFTAPEFHRRCDSRANTLTFISDTEGNVFGGFTPVKWESREWNRKGRKENNCYQGDDSLQSFLFTLRNLYGVPPRKFALKAEKKQYAIYCTSVCCAALGYGCEIAVKGNIRRATTACGVFSSH